MRKKSSLSPPLYKLLVFLLAAVALFNLFAPPFQSPDEPHHFAAIMMIVYSGQTGH